MDNGASFLIGAVMATALVLFMISESGTVAKKDAYNQAISECEALLPRDQHCIITAIPYTGENK